MTGITFLAVRRAFVATRPFRCPTLILMLAAGLFCLNGCGDRLVARKIESGVKARLHEIIGPADSYEVSVTGSAARMMSGRISGLTINGEGVRLDGGFYVDQLVVRMRNVRFDADSNRFGGSEQTTFEAVVSDESLTRLVTVRQPELKNLAIGLSNGIATVRTTPSVMGVSANVALMGRLEQGIGNEINFVSEQMSVSGISVPGIVRDFVMQRINPVMILPSLGFPATLTRVGVTSNYIKVEGSADLTGGM